MGIWESLRAIEREEVDFFFVGEAMTGMRENKHERHLKSLVFVCHGCHNKIYFLITLEAGHPRSRCWQGWFLLRPLSLACMWPSPCCVLTRPFLCVRASLVSLPLLMRTPVISD